MESMIRLLSCAAIGAGLIVLVQFGTTRPAVAQCSPGVCCWGFDGNEYCTTSDAAKKGKHHVRKHRRHKHVGHSKPTVKPKGD